MKVQILNLKRTRESFFSSSKPIVAVFLLKQTASRPSSMASGRVGDPVGMSEHIWILAWGAGERHIPFGAYAPVCQPAPACVSNWVGLFRSFSLFLKRKKESVRQRGFKPAPPLLQGHGYSHQGNSPPTEKLARFSPFNFFLQFGFLFLIFLLLFFLFFLIFHCFL